MFEFNPSRSQVVRSDILKYFKGVLQADGLRKTAILEPAEDKSDCVNIREEVRETIDWKPGEIFVNRTVLNIYNRLDTIKAGKVVVIKAARPISKCLAGLELLVQVTIDKLIDHKLLNRQIEAFKRKGIIIPYSTVLDWVGLIPLGTIHLKKMYKYQLLACG